MESRYGIGINNRYAMFFDSEDGEEGTILPKKAPVKEEVKPVANAKPAAPVKKAEDPKKSQTNAKSNNKPNSREGKIFCNFEKFVQIEKGPTRMIKLKVRYSQGSQRWLFLPWGPRVTLVKE